MAKDCFPRNFVYFLVTDFYRTDLCAAWCSDWRNSEWWITPRNHRNQNRPQPGHAIISQEHNPWRDDCWVGGRVGFWLDSCFANSRAGYKTDWADCYFGCWIIFCI